MMHDPYEAYATSPRSRYVADARVPYSSKTPGEASFSGGAQATWVSMPTLEELAPGGPKPPQYRSFASYPSPGAEASIAGGDWALIFVQFSTCSVR